MMSCQLNLRPKASRPRAIQNLRANQLLGKEANAVTLLLRKVRIFVYLSRLVGNSIRAYGSLLRIHIVCFGMGVYELLHGNPDECAHSRSLDTCDIRGRHDCV